MLDRIVANEEEPDIVQVSGGEPTCTRQFFGRARRLPPSPDPPSVLNTKWRAHRHESGLRGAPA